MLTVNNKKICELCFSEFPLFSDTCSQCDGKCLNEQKGGTWLAKGTILAGRYLVGKTISYSHIYFCYDLNTNSRLIVYEYFPYGFASRVEGGNTLVYSDTVLDINFPDDQGIGTFITEAKKFYKIGRSPYFFNICDLFYENNTAYCILEYIDFQRIKPYSPENEALYIMMQLMDALEHLHNHGMVYKYLNYLDILVDKEKNIKLYPFCETRKMLDDLFSVYHDAVPVFRGSVELFRSNGHIGPWTDIFSLGEIIYKMITGRTPEFSVERLSGNEYIDPTGISTEFYLILNKMLKTKSQDRYQNINELRHDVNLLKLKPKPPFYFS